MTANNTDTLKIVADSLESAGKSDSGWILHHVMDGREIELPFIGYIHIPQIPPVPFSRLQSQSPEQWDSERPHRHSPVGWRRPSQDRYYRTSRRRYNKCS